MSFLSLEFFFLVTLVFLLYWLLPARLRPALLTAASLFFYAVNGNILHLILVVVVNWYLVLWLAPPQEPVKAKKILAFAVSLNLLHLAFFKYINSLLALPPVLKLLATHEPPWRVVQPLAISFYTFQVIGFLVDVYRGQVPNLSFKRFLLFMIFSPT